MPNAYQRTFSKNALRAAWQHLYRNAKPSSRKTVGIDDISINDFESDATAHLRTLHNEIASGCYVFSDLRPVLIKKSNNKDRLICIPTVRDRIVQRAALQFLMEKYGDVLKNEISYGFLPNRSVQDAATVAIRIRRKKRWAFKTDISSFFDRIPRESLSRRIKKLVRESTLHPILDSAIACEVGSSHRSYQERIKRIGIRAGLGVRQGMPLSPFFSNVILQEFDSSVVNAGYQAVRYADDLIFFSDSEAECRSIFEYCKEKLAKLGLEVPEIGDGSKSAIYQPAEEAEFLGLSLMPVQDRYELMLSEKRLSQIRDELRAFSSAEEMLNRRITLKTYLPAINAKVAGYLDAYQCCSNYAQLEEELQRSVNQSLRWLYTDSLKIDI
jgi:group II intron reverse transcriptase/maturase